MGLQDLDPFVETSEGRAFFPYHRLAPGYLLAPSDEASLKRVLRRLRWACFAVVMASLLAKPWLEGHDFRNFLIFMALYMGLWFAVVAIHCRGLARTRGRMPRLDATRRAAAALSNGFIVYGLVVCLLFAVGGIAMYLNGIGDPTMAIITAVLFTGFWLWYCRIALTKWNPRRPDGRDAVR